MEPVTLFDFLTMTKAACYVAAALLLASFIPFWFSLTERER
ncbi:MAG: hmc operon protein 4 [Deltaproteobacteria bacterium]|nr:hmc operon protein 4 [Deltaproteobacteria bacterium]